MHRYSGGELFDLLPDFVHLPTDKKWSVYNFNGMFYLTVRDRITHNPETHSRKSYKFFHLISNSITHSLFCPLFLWVNKYFFNNPFAKHDLVLGVKTLVGSHRGQMFLVVDLQVCTHLRRDLGHCHAGIHIHDPFSMPSFPEPSEILLKFLVKNFKLDFILIFFINYKCHFY